MKIKHLLILSVLFCTLTSNAQRQAANWYFGNNAGINFDDSNNVTALTDGALFTEEGCTSISDDDGNLLFYTNGENVYNRNHQVMPNGFNLNGNQSSTQSAIIIPKPQNSDIYYIFTVDTEFNGDPDEGFQWSEIDMSLDGGLGDITNLKNQILLNNSSEKLSAVLKDCQSESIWVVTFADENGFGNNFNTVYAYEVTATGVNTNPVISTLPVNITEQRGYLKFSPNGEKLAFANLSQGFFIANFDLNSGNATFQSSHTVAFQHNNSSTQSPYGLEFSPNSNFLYVSSYFQANDINNPNIQYNALLQYDMNAINLGDSEILIDDRQGYRSALQLGPDGNIYRTISETYNTGVPFLSVIEDPNNLGLACNYQNAAIDLNNQRGRQGLPPFIASFFSENIDIIPNDNSTTENLFLCNGDTYELVGDDIFGASYIWTRDDIVITNNTNTLTISEPGIYKVFIDPNTGDCNILEGKAIVSYYEVPIANTPSNILICDTNNDNRYEFDFTLKDSVILNGQDPSTFSVHYFNTIIDANANENNIEGLYTNSSNTETIFVRVYNRSNASCYDLTQFEIGVFKTPVFNAINNIIFCDDDSDGDNANGQTTITVSYTHLTLPTIYSV